ncbi:lysozyme [Rouxiella chamberiensis]|uniref:lysozyme n=1 Tax=Rouxiella chamberiensis TaxID=1513468 RepID=UPI0005D3A9C4|nr:lysozyme [Rouxiella chamberiensis]
MNTLVKRCLAAAVLLLAATLPDYRQLHTSEAGLRLITDFEGCRLSPYKCQAGTWTNGIGHTVGVTGRSHVTERQAATNLVDDVKKVESQLAVCAPVAMPQPVYDALVSFSFNVGTGAACRSTLVSYLNRHQWWQACDQLTRWVFVNGKVSAGLERRRQAERKLCLSGV